MMSIQIKAKKKTCPMCSKEATVRAVERVPGGGVLYRCTHIDGSKECEFSEYNNLPKAGIIDDPSPEIRCPECNEYGVVKTERDVDRTKPDSWNYYVSHPTSKCLVIEEHRNIALKAVGRYIGIGSKPVKIGHTKGKISLRVICPRCNKEGRAERFEDNGRLRVRVVHGEWKKRKTCSLAELDHKIMIAKVLGLSSYNRERLEKEHYKSRCRTNDSEIKKLNEEKKEMIRTLETVCGKWKEESGI